MQAYIKLIGKNNETIIIVPAGETSSLIISISCDGHNDHKDEKIKIQKNLEFSIPREKIESTNQYCEALTSSEERKKIFSKTDFPHDLFRKISASVEKGINVLNDAKILKRLKKIINLRKTQIDNAQKMFDQIRQCDL